MRLWTGNLLIFLFIGIFSTLFVITVDEFYEAKSIHEVLDEKIILDSIHLSETSIILDKNKEVISDVYAAEKRIHLPYKEIPKIVVDAFLSAEDQSFFEHKGFDMKGIARALIINLQNDSIEQGGSTVTQQLVRNLYLTHEKSYERKLSELLYAYQMERLMEKEDIMELYINAIYFKNGVYGIEAATRFYFNKTADELSVAEAAFLSAIPNHPDRYNPLTNIEHTHERKEWILLKMLEEEKITKETYDKALNESIELNIYHKIDEYPDYVTYIHHELKELISDNEGYSKRLSTAKNEASRTTILQQLNERVDAVLNQGIIIETALDNDIQEQAVRSINSYIGNSQLQAATTIIDHKKNEIVAITGGKDYEKFHFHRGFQAYRQPGSAIKPLLVFAPYIEETNTNERTTIDASPFNKNGYTPINYGGATYGRVSMEQAFKHSYNTAAVRLFDRTDPEIAFSYFDHFDFQGVDEKDIILPAALGGFTTGVSVLEMTRAYTTFATNGEYHSPKAIRQVLDKNGDILYSWDHASERVWSERTNNEVRKMMRRVVNEGTGRNAKFSTSGYLGGKTGTTNNYHDLWFIGSTDTYTSGIWIGYDSPTSMSHINQRLHLEIWRSYMSKIVH
ncbi:transglycosylase domain-containing protein [Evansella sp. AB-P1]|uniref:transglycosylase domain-containing protein n=1 Tax=Evansella sp. AB-P1 TaxID=3037653 RepID=UPI00241E576F|nr:transglycosylase domain-containing protein [Evansella sp. AB-P1]MDG5788786.1 transglycosylase domain-containing protein [Evansella sp. AB-P1]